MRPKPIHHAALTALLALGLAAGPLGAQDAERRQRIDTTFAFDATGSVSLGVLGGEIKVQGGGAGTIRIEASIERGWLDASMSRSRVSIEVRANRGRAGSAEYVLTVPPGTRVSASAVSGDIIIEGTGGEVTATSVNGDVTVRGSRRRLEATTVTGDLDVSDASGMLRLESVNSDILADGLIGELTAETVSGEIELRRSRLDAIRATTVAGDIQYDGPFAPRGSYRFETHAGDIDFGLPANAGASLSLETYSGDISSEFPLTLQPGQPGRSRRMEFTLGAGGSRISAESFSGDITIRRLPASGNQE